MISVIPESELADVDNALAAASNAWDAEFESSFEPAARAKEPSANSTAGASYQLIRHGADYGSQQVPGSSLYSELNIEHRNKLKKYFLHDGAYNWMHVLSTGGNYTLNTKVPVSFYGNLGIIFSYFTIIDPDNYDRSVPGNEGNCKNADFSTPISIAGTDEYPTMFGAVLTLGVRINY